MSVTAAVTTRSCAQRVAVIAPAASIWAMIQPPKMSPDGLMSAGIARVRAASSPRGPSTSAGGTATGATGRWAGWSAERELNIGQPLGLRRSSPRLNAVSPLMLQRSIKLPLGGSAPLTPPLWQSLAPAAGGRATGLKLDAGLGQRGGGEPRPSR